MANQDEDAEWAGGDKLTALEKENAELREKLSEVMVENTALQVEIATYTEFEGE